VPQGDVTSLGSAIFAFLAAGAFSSIEEAQKAMCPSHRVFEPEPRSRQTYDEMYALYRKLYFGFGCKNASAVAIGDVLPSLRHIAERVRRTS
jgi:L-ribulokinase